MQVVPQELRAAVPTMAIKDCKEGRLLDARRQLFVRFATWLLEVEDDRDPVFVVGSTRAVVCVCSVAHDVPLRFARDLAVLYPLDLLA